MSPRLFQLFDGTGTREDFIWPFAGAALSNGALSQITSWRQFGHSWASGGFDDQNSPESTRTRITERIAGMLHISPDAVQNDAIFGSHVMSEGGQGFGRVLQKIVPHATTQNWPWEPDRYAVEAFLFGVNDIGGGPYFNSGARWAGQDQMWNYVWANTWRSVIQRCIAGAIYAARPGFGGQPMKLWRNPNVPPSGANVSDFAFTALGPAAGGAAHWTFKTERRCNSGDGYWWTDQAGDRMVITVPVDYDTSTIAVRHLCPGSWFDGPVVQRAPNGATGGAEAIPVRTGAEHLRAPSAVTIVGGNINATVNCQGLANRYDRAANAEYPGGAGVNPGAGNVGLTGAMTHVSRHGLTPTPGTAQTLTLTVGGLPAGGWYGFDSWEIQARQEFRPIVAVATVANPADWELYFASPTTGAFYAATAATFSTIINSICLEFVDPGIMSVDIRSAIALAPTSYAELTDTHITGTRVIGDVVELSSHKTLKASGDGTHPHALGERLIIGAFMDRIAAAGLPRGRGAVPFAPARALAYGRRS